MKVATWNVNGIRARHAQLVEWVAREAPDVLCLQELKATPAQIPDPLTTLSEYWSFWHGGPKGYSGVSLHLRRATFPAAPKFGHPTFDHECRTVEAVAGGVRWASIYVPNGGKDYAAKVAFLRELEAWARGRTEAGEQLVLCGDLNVALTDRDVHPKELKAGAIGQRADERALLSRAIGHGLVDVTRALHPGDDDLFTWWPPWRQMRERNIGWRIDLVLMSEALARSVRAAEVRREIGTSDHAPLVVTFERP
ncbi:MAG: exodeoxyribonuclease III [Deltaproteobacteria bacterium]|nr:exodeoxyribonuclease III [Deltaproteobacteria bacterium]